MRLCRLYLIYLHVISDGLPTTRGGHSNRLCANTHDQGQERGQAVKAEKLEGQAVKGTSQIRKSQGSSKLKVNWIKSHQSTIPHLVG